MLNADRAYFNKDSSDAQILEGNVQIQHNGAVMYCEKAFLFDKENRAEAYHKVHINQGDTVNLYGDSLKYYGNRKYAQMRGNIKLIDRKMTLVTDSLNYDMYSSIAYYTGGGTLTNLDDGTVLNSLTGVYYAQSRSMIFSDSVTLKGEAFNMWADTLEYNVEDEITYFRGPTHIESDSAAITCTGGWHDANSNKSKFTGRARFTSKEQDAVADTIYYQQKKGAGTLIGNVEVNDTTNRTTIFGQYGEFMQQNNHAMITGKALFVQYFDKDTLYLHGDTLLAKKDSLDQRLLLAYFNVRIFKRDFQGVCDSMSFSESDSLLILYGNPILWQETNQLTAEIVRIKTYQGKVERMDLLQAAFIVSEADTIGFNQIKGRTMNAYFHENELHKIVVTGNGQTLYYAGEEGKDYIGMNRADCSDILIYIDSSKIQTISFLNKPEAKLIPLSQIKDEERELNDFRWEIMRRPECPEDVIILE